MGYDLVAHFTVNQGQIDGIIASSNLDTHDPSHQIDIVRKKIESMHLHASTGNET